MDLRSLSGVEISKDVLKLYQALHLDKGEADEDKYVKNVLKYYNTVFNKVITTEKIENVKCDIKNPDDIEKTFSTLVKLLDVKKQILELIDKFADFTKLEVSKSTSKNIAEDSYAEWLESSSLKLQSLPIGEGYVGETYITYPLRLLNKIEAPEFRVPEEDYDYISKRIYGEAAKTDLDEIRDIYNNIHDNGAESDYKSAFVIASVYLEDDQIISLNDIYLAYRNVISSLEAKRLAEIRHDRNMKLASLLSGLFSALAITITVFILLWYFRPSIFVTFEQLSEDIIFGVWANIWRYLVLDILFGLAIAGIYVLSFGYNKPVLSFLYTMPVFPRFLNTFIIIYLALWSYGINGQDLINFLSVDPSYADSYLLVLQVTGIGAAVSSLVFEIDDIVARGSSIVSFKDRFASRNRGRVFFSNIWACFPTLLFVAFMCIIGWVHYITTWVFAGGMLICDAIFLAGGFRAAKKGEINYGKW